MDDLVLIFTLWNFEVPEKDGVSGGIPGGYGPEGNAGGKKQVLYMCLKEGQNVAAAGFFGAFFTKGPKGARAVAEPVYKTTKEAQRAAEALGFRKIKETVHNGQAVFKRGNDFITRDISGHNGGAWKMADSVKALGSKETRAGTFDIHLNRIGD